MPLKIRCSSCQTVLRIPDSARGKKVRCPKCEAKLRIPEATKKKREAVGADRPDSAAFLLNLDVNRLEDQNARICPRCGVDVGPEDLECPKCGVDLQTGVMSAATRRKRQRKGPDPAEFYRTAWKDSWRFLKHNTGLGTRLAVSWSLFSTLSVTCWIMVLWCTTWPPQVFWTFLGFVCAMIPPGFTWFLHVEIIRATLAKKDKLKRLHADLFQNVALGIKLLAWIVVITLPFQLVTGTGAFLFWRSGLQIGAIFLATAGMLGPFLLFPIAMSHMAMPVTYKGWLAHKLLGTLPKVILPTVYWCILCFVTMIPVLAGLGVIGGVFGRNIVDFKTAIERRSTIAAAQHAISLIHKESPPEALVKLSAEPPPAVPWLGLIAPGVIWIATCVAFGFASIFNMRTNGNIALYFRPELDLIADVKEYKYVAKARTDEMEEPEKSTVATVLVFAVMSLVGSVVMGIRNEAPFFFMVVGLLAFLSWIPVAGLWRIFEKAHEPGWYSLVPIYQYIVLARIAQKPGWWGALMLIPVVNLLIWVILSIEISKQFGQGAGFGIGLALLSPIFFCILGFGPYKYGPQSA